MLKHQREGYFKWFWEEIMAVWPYLVGLQWEEAEGFEISRDMKYIRTMI